MKVTPGCNPSNLSSIFVVRDIGFGSEKMFDMSYRRKPNPSFTEKQVSLESVQAVIWPVVLHVLSELFLNPGWCAKCGFACSVREASGRSD